MKRVLTRTFALLALAGISTVAIAESLPRPNMNLALDEYNIELTDYVLPSGLRIIFQEDHTQPIISITSVIDRGSSHDPVGREGIAHLVEHLWFRSLHGDLPKVWEVLKEMGAGLNASTASDWTNYMTIAPKDQLVPLLRLEALRIEAAVRGVTEEDVNTEREIVRNELRMRYENTDGSALWYLRPKLYPEGHPYHRLGIGTHDSLNNITLKDIQDFVDENYTPENTTIVVVGDFEIAGTNDEGEDVNYAWQYIQDAFPMELLVDPEDPEGPFELKEPPVRVSPEWDEPPEPADTTISYHKGGVEKPTMVLAWSLPGAYRSHTPMMRMTGGSWMTRAIRTYLVEDFDILTDDIEDLDSMGCFVWDEEVNSAAMCFIEMSEDDDPEEIREKALDGLYHMWDLNNRPVMDFLYDYGKSAQMASIFQSVEIVSSIGNGRAAETANFTHFTGDPLYYSRQFEWLNTVTAHDAAKFAEKYLNRDRAVAVVIEPYDEGDISLDSSDAIYKGAVRQAETASMIDLSEVDAEYLKGLMSPPDLSSIREFDLDNGMHVVMLPYGTAPLAQVSVVFKGGSYREPAFGLNEYTFQWLQSDYTDDPLRIAGNWAGGTSTTHSYVGMSGSSANIDAMIYMTRRELESRFINVDTRRTWAEAAKKSARYERGFPEWWASNVAQSRVLPEHPAAWRPDELYYDALKYSNGEMGDWMDTVYRPDNATIFVLGRMDDADAVEDAIRTYFNGWKVKGDPVAFSDLPSVPPAEAERAVVVFDKQRVSQTQAQMVCQIGPATLENSEAREMLAAVLDEMAWDALREQSGVTYGASSYDLELAGGTAIMGVSSLVQNDAAALVVETMFRLSDEAEAGEFDYDLLTLMKLSSSRRYVLGQQTTGQMLNRIQAPFTTGYGWELIDGRAERLANVTPEDLQAQMERCHGREVVTLVGPVEVITPQLDEAGIPYEVFDWKAEADLLFAQNDPKAYEKKKKKEAKEAKKKAKEGEEEEEG